MTSNGHQDATHIHGQPQVIETTVRDAVQVAKAATRHGAAATEQDSRVASDAMQQGGEATAGATRHGSEAMTDMAQRATDGAIEATRRNLQVVAEGQRKLAQAAAERFADVRQTVAQTVQDTTETVRELMALPNAAHTGLRDLQQGVTGLFEGVMRTNVAAAQEMFRLFNPNAAVEMQQRFAREYLDAVLKGSATLLRATRRTADETLRPLERQIERRQQASQGTQSYQHAAE